ncbi:MAG TPA: PD-(D/E)XK nuclease family protein [Acidimicrobiales bacterium]|nr:PD-(D/E)XK nuclease family protein [Acidimicrobiales bacterium]
MPGRVRTVAYGPPAFAALAEAVEAAKEADPLAPVHVVVASRRAAFDLRRRLARAGGRTGLVNVRLEPLADLAASLASRAGLLGERRPATAAALAAAARGALRASPGRLAAVAAHPSTEAELATVYLDLRRHEDGLAALARLERHDRDLVRLVRAMRAALEPRFHDDVDRLEAARRALESWPEGRIGSVVVHLPEDLSPAERRLLAALGRAGALTVHVGLVGDPAADAPAAELVRELVAAGLTLVGELPDPPSPGEADTAVAGLRVLEAEDPDAEVRAAVRLLLERLEAGAEPARLALLCTSWRRYASRAAACLEEAGLAWNGPSPRRLADAPTARVLACLLALAEGGLSRSGVVALLAAGPVRDPDGGLAPLGEWDRCSRLAGVVGGDAAAWRRQLGALVEEASVEARRRSGKGADGTEVAPGGGAERAELAATALARFVTGLEARLAAGTRLARWSGFVEWAASLLRAYLGPDEERASWPGFAGPADRAVVGALESLAELDGLDPSPDLTRFSAAVARALDRSAAPSGHLGSGILLAPLELAAGLDLDSAVVLGCVEGALPRRARSSPLLGQAQRRALGLAAASAAEVVVADRRRLLAAARSCVRAVVALPRRDGTTGRRPVRSRFVPAPAGDGLPARSSWPPIGRDELEVALLERARRGGEPLARHFLVGRAPQLRAGLELIGGRQAFGPYSGRVGVRGLAETLATRAFSPTTLERYATCPFAYFLEHELGCEVVDPPEARLDLDPRERGRILHEVLERFVRELVEAPVEEAGDGPGSEARLAAIAEEVFARYERLGRTGRPALWLRRRRQLLALLEAERRRDAARRAASGAVPVAVERSFGMAGQPPVRLRIAGRELAFRGTIDRIDRAPDGTLAVIDYKSGAPNDFAGLERDPVDAGRHLQLPLYGLAARSLDGEPARVAATYRFLDHGGDRFGIEVDEATVRRLEEVLTVLVSSIDAGCFPLRPGRAERGGFAHCRRCDFDRLCVADRARAWDEARAAPELAAYVSLVEQAGDA